MTRYEIPLPLLYDASLSPVRRLYPMNEALTLSLKPLSTANLTVSRSENIQMHDWIELYTPHGSAGMFRVAQIENTVNDNEVRLTLEHGLCVMRDAIADIAQTARRYTAVDIRSTETTVSFTGTQAQVEAACIAYQDSKPGYTPNWAITAEDNGTYFEGTPANVLQQILEYQTIRVSGVKLWQKGTVAPTGTVRIDVKHDNCLDLLDAYMEELPEYMIVTDQSSFPWTISIVARPTEVSAEGRLSRNLTRAQISYDDSELYTRVYMDDLPNGYMDADTISTYGIIGKYIDSGDKLSVARKTQLCQRYLAKHKNPAVSITLDAVELKQLTGEDLDAVDVGRLYRVALPDYGITLNEQVVTLYYTDVYNQPGGCNITLANDEKVLISKISEIKKQASSGGGRADKIEEDAEIQKTKYDLQVSQDNKHFGVLATEAQWSEVMNAYYDTHKTYFGSTARMFQIIATENEYASLEAGDVTLVQHMTSEFTQTAQQIALKVSKGAVATQLAIECGNVTITGGNLTVDGYVTASAFDAEQARFDNLVSGTTTATALKASLLQATTTFNVGGTIFRGTTISIGSVVSYTGLTSANASINLDHSHAITMTESGGVVTATLGAARTTSSSDRIANFNIADTAYFINAVSAATSQGYRNAANAVQFPNSGTKTSMTVTYPNTSGTTSQMGFYITEGSWSGGKKTISLRRERDTGAIVAQKSINMPSSGTWTIESRTGTQYGIPISASFRAGGKTYTYTGEI